MNYVIGALFPKSNNGNPNLVLANNLDIYPVGLPAQLRGPFFPADAKGSFVPVALQAPFAINQVSAEAGKAQLGVELNITTDPISINGIENFLKNWYIPQITDKKAANSIFSQVKSGVIQGWENQARNKSMSTLLTIGYLGPGANNAATNDSFWNAVGRSDGNDPYWAAINNPDNYDPQALWGNYQGDTKISSNYDSASLLQNLDKANQSPELWYPSILYTYGIPGQGQTFPGPVIVTAPATDISIKFNNDIRIPGLSLDQIQQATTVRNSTYGNSASDGLGGTSSTNFHSHGLHVNPTGFGDNVVARYTAGQEWTTKLDIPSDHGIGSYWYHPHYHPSVNQQVYGGLSGFMQIGDPLSKIPYFQNVARNIAVVKALDIGIDGQSGDLVLGANASLGGVANQMTMVTVNGEFQPIAEINQGGWQSLSLSNQANQAMYNISLIHTDSFGKTTTLPLYIYGEDGHQYPQIRAAQGTLGSNFKSNPESVYAQAENLISLPPGKRVDILFYLPKGRTELASTYNFEKGGKKYQIKNMGGYPDLTSQNVNQNATNAGAGPLAIFNVQNGGGIPSKQQLDIEIANANTGIQVQEILPTTQQSEYNPNMVPSVNLYATTESGEVWQPLRKREFNWAKGTLVGPAEEWDQPTQELLKSYTEANNGKVYERYRKLPVQSPGVPNWLGYSNPFLINDHVFPNGNLTITQLGTLEEWRLKNWSVNSPQKYIGHPFHIHVNDYQVKNSDTELLDKRNLEDVTMINSSGFRYYDTNSNKIVEQKPFRGEFHAIPEAVDPQITSSLATWGANDQTVRMLFQDYLGTYVFHCHILPHEDAGMMQVVTVIENTDSSWLAPVEGFRNKEGTLELYGAQNFNSFKLTSGITGNEQVSRLNLGDINGDFIQDIVLSIANQAGSGYSQIFDGKSLLNGETRLVSELIPYEGSSGAPWTFAEDFSGDGRRDLVTAGFQVDQKDPINLKDLQIRAWSSYINYGKDWEPVFSFKPFESIEYDVNHGNHVGHVTPMAAHTLKPSDTLNMSQISVTMADMNLDNFQDVVIVYALQPHMAHTGFRIIVLDGAAITLQYQTGSFEGGYFPNQEILADALILDPSLSELSQLVVSAGFNSYAQSALENVVVTTQSSSGSQQFTIQLQAGHFIATSEQGGHGGHTQKDDRVINLLDDSMPINIVDQLILPQGSVAATPVFTGAFANGAVLTGDQLSIAQGNAANGNPANSNINYNSAQQLIIDLNSLLKVDIDDLTGIISGNLDSTFSPLQVAARNHLTAMTYKAYAGSTLWPSGQSALAASILGEGQTATQLAETLNTAPGYKTDVETYYGGTLENLPVSDIVTKATESLYARTASQSEINQWQQQVNQGLDRSLIPLAILQSSNGNDRYRVALLSAASQWNNAQWGTTANVAGSFGQGFQSDVQRYSELDDLLNSIGPLSSWEQAQSAFDAYTNQALEDLIGTPVSKSGFF